MWHKFLTSVAHFSAQVLHTCSTNTTQVWHNYHCTWPESGVRTPDTRTILWRNNTTNVHLQVNHFPKHLISIFLIIINWPHQEYYHCHGLFELWVIDILSVKWTPHKKRPTFVVPIYLRGNRQTYKKEVTWQISGGYRMRTWWQSNGSWRHFPYWPSACVPPSNLSLKTNYFGDSKKFAQEEADTGTNHF